MVEFLSSITANNHITVTVIISVGLFIAVAIYEYCLYIVQKLHAYTGLNFESVVTLIRGPMSVTVFMSAVLLGISNLSQTTVYTKWTQKTLITVLIVLWTLTFLRIGDEVLESLIEDTYGKDIAPIIENIWTLVAIFGGIGLLFIVWGVNITPILASAGVIGIVIGFAAKDTIANFFGSLALYADNTYSAGDFIELDNSTRGWVMDISIRSTQLRTLDGDIVTVPNSLLNNEIVRNKDQPSRKHRITTEVGVAYSEDVEEVRDLLKYSVESVDMIVENPPPRVHLREFGDSAIVFELLVHIENVSLKKTVEDDLHTNIYKNFTAAGIEIPYPQRDIYLKNS